VISAQITGLLQVRDSMAKWQRSCTQAFAAALYQKGQAIMADAIPLTPKRYGILRGSYYVAPPEPSGGSVFSAAFGTGPAGYTVEIGYGAYYALYVHEMSASYNYTAPGTGPKFLQRAVEQHRAGWSAWIAGKTVENQRAGIGMASLSGPAPRRPKR